MRRVVVDASVVLAGLFKDGTARDALLGAGCVALSAPSYLRAEVARHLSEVSARAGVPIATVETILEDLWDSIEIVPPGVYASWGNPARRMAEAAGAPGDADSIALALALEAPVWTLGKGFLRVYGLKVLSTQQMSTGKAEVRAHRHGTRTSHSELQARRRLRGRGGSWRGHRPLAEGARLRSVPEAAEVEPGSTGVAR